MRRRILLVDDDVTVLLTLKAVLELNHFEVDTASSAAEAMEKLDLDTYQMVITDARMETDDAGFHVLRAARRQQYNPATALLTAYPAHNSTHEADEMQSVLVKPVGTGNLLRQIEALLITHEDKKQVLAASRATGQVATGIRRNSAAHASSRKKPL